MGNLTGVLEARFPKKPEGTTLVPRDTSLGRLTVDVNAHESSTARHGSPPDQTTEGIHHPWLGSDALTVVAGVQFPVGEIIFD
ncbi:hypothetical protein F4703DRAFT_1935194 [Phycomyces blakesleeanus]